jgi:hypothetical protein
MGPVGCPETSAINVQYALSNNPEERSLHLLHDGSLKSRKGCVCSTWNILAVCRSDVECVELGRLVWAGHVEGSK